MAHAQKCALRKRHVKQRGGAGNGDSQAELIDQQKWSERPQFIEHENKRKKRTKLPREPSITKSGRTQQIQTNGNAGPSGKNQNWQHPARTKRAVQQNRVNLANAGERGQIKN